MIHRNYSKKPHFSELVGIKYLTFIPKSSILPIFKKILPLGELSDGFVAEKFSFFWQCQSVSFRMHTFHAPFWQILPLQRVVSDVWCVCLSCNQYGLMDKNVKRLEILVKGLDSFLVDCIFVVAKKAHTMTIETMNHLTKCGKAILLDSGYQVEHNEDADGKFTAVTFPFSPIVFSVNGWYRTEIAIELAKEWYRIYSWQ